VPVDKLSVVFVVVFAAPFFLHEQLTWLHWDGGVLIASGAVILAFK
jgi:uncharacterized membrane protein